MSPSFFVYGDGEVSTQRTPNNRFLVFQKAVGLSDFPKRLQDGEKVSLHVNFAHIKEGLNKEGYCGTVSVYPTCKDNAGKRYWGKKWKFDASLKWAE
jgi:hypothetical protein